MNYSEASQAYDAGKTIAGEEIQGLERKIQTSENALELRFKLLGYYRKHLTENFANYTRHATWIIDRYPGEEFAFFVFIVKIKVFSPDSYEEMKKHWLKHFESASATTGALINALDFFYINGDKKLAISLLPKLEMTTPQESDFVLLAGLYERLSRDLRTRHEGVRKKELRQKALYYNKKAGDVDSDAEHELFASCSMANFAFETNSPQAKYLALQLLSKAAKNPPAYGYAIHVGNIVLGKIALLEDKQSQAAHHLILAGEAPSSHILSDKGPDMSLASALLKLGEVEIVSDFVNKMSQHDFNESCQKMLERWRVVIRDGKGIDIDALVASMFSRFEL